MTATSSQRPSSTSRNAHDPPVEIREVCLVLFRTDNTHTAREGGERGEWPKSAPRQLRRSVSIRGYPSVEYPLPRAPVYVDFGLLPDGSRFRASGDRSWIGSWSNVRTVAENMSSSSGKVR